MCMNDFLTDIFYRFWYDLFVTKKESEEPSTQAQSEITISMSKEKQIAKSAASGVQKEEN